MTLSRGDPTRGVESLDWSAPQLLEQFWFPVERQLRDGIATRVYVVFGFLASSMYRRLRPRGVVLAQALLAVLAAFWMRRFVWACIARFVSFLGRGEVRHVDPHPRREFAGTQARAS